MKMIRHGIAGLVLFAVLATLFVGVYNDFSEAYSFTDTSAQSINGGNSMSVLEHINNLNIIEGMSEAVEGIVTLASPDSFNQFFDASIQAGLGIFKFIFGILSFPVEILGIIGAFYPVPGAVISGLIIVIIVYIAFIFYSRNLRGEV